MVGAGIGGGFNHTSELNVLNYNDALKTQDMETLVKRVNGIDDEHARFLFNEVWTAVLRQDYDSLIPVTMTWAVKLKASGVV